MVYIPPKRAFHNIFKPKTCGVYKPCIRKNKGQQPPECACQRRQMRIQEQTRRWHSGSMFFVLSLTLVQALHEIRYYQRGDLLLIRFTAFTRLVREITDDCKRGLHWKRDAIHALQIMTEHILVMIFSMTLSG